MASTDEARTALETRNRSSAPVANGETRAIASTVKKVIDRQAGELARVLPPSMDADRFARLVLTAVRSTPQLILAFGTPQGEQSVLFAAMASASIGLEPNTPTQQAWLVPRKDHGTWECRLWIGYRGLLTLVRRSDTVKELVAGVVRENDDFAWSRELDRDTLSHRPADGDRGKATHVYSIARLLNGGVQFSVLTRSEVEARRASSDSWTNQKSRPFSPWVKWPDSMWMKSAVRSLVPWLDLSTGASHDVGRAMSFDERRLTLDDTDEIPALEAVDDGDGDAAFETGEPVEVETDENGDADQAEQPAGVQP